LCSHEGTFHARIDSVLTLESDCRYTMMVGV
jgi:hypothetical protein